MMKTMLTIILVVASLTTNAQDYKEDFRKIGKYYSDTGKVLHYKMNVELYDRANRGLIKETMKTEFMLYGSYSLQRLGPELTISRPGIKMILNEEEKVIALKKKAPNKNAFVNIGQLADSLLKSHKPLVKSIVAPPGQRAYCFVFENNVADSTQIYFDEKTFAIRNLLFYYSSSAHLTQDEEYRPLVKMTFYDQEKRSRKSSDFSLDAYIKKVDQKYLPKAPYSDFKIINNL